MASSVVPFAPSIEAADAIVYELQSSRDLPTFDPDKAVKHAVLSPRSLATFNRLLHHARGWVSLFYAVGFISGSVVLFVPANIGEAFAIAALVTEIPTFVAAYLMLRYDIMVLICKTFEFWYVSAVNIVCALLMALKFNDLRFFLVVAAAFAYEIPFLMDAVNRATTVTVIASAIGAVADVTYIAVLLTNQLDDTKYIRFFAQEEGRFTADSVVINGLATVIVLLLRNAYRKHQLIHTQPVFCGTYWIHCQRQLLRFELFASFDFMFMVLQFTLAHLCLGFLIGWNVNSLNVLTSWLWSHWLITLDAVTPVMKRKLGYNFYGAIIVVVVILAEQLAFIIDVGTRGGSAFETHVAIDINGTKVRVVSFLFWRLFTSMLWSSRLLWRLLDRRVDELLILQGQTQYDDSRPSTRGVRHDIKTNAVASAHTGAKTST